MVEEGELVVLSGRTGVGKSTLLGVVTGLVPRFSGGRLSGDVLFDGCSIVRTPPRERVDRIGYVGQDPLSGFVTDTVEEELAYGMEQLGLPGPTMRRRVEETLDLLGIADLRSRDLRTLSGGQQQRVAIGSVLAMHPRLLVLDEPTSALDPTAAEDVLATLTRLVHDAGLSVLLAEHRLERVLPFADRIALLTGDGGLLVGAPAQVLPHSPVVPPIIELGRAARWEPLPLTVRDARRRTRDLTLPAPPDPAPAADGKVRLEATGVSVTHGRLLAVRDVDLRLHAGTTTALMGRNGSGKSTLLWTLQGTGKRRGGDVAIDDEGSPVDPAMADPAQRRSLVGLVPQTAADLLYLETVDEECAAADEGAGVVPGTCRGLLDGLVPGLARRPAPARPVRGPAARAGAGDRAHRAARASCCSTSRPAGSTTPPRRTSPATCAPSPPRGTRSWSRRTTSSSWPRSPTTSSCWPRVRSSPPGRYAAWSPSRRRSPRRSPRSSDRPGCGSTSSSCEVPRERAPGRPAPARGP